MLTFSITQGILWGFIAHVLLWMVGRRQEVHPVMNFLGALSVGLLAMQHDKKVSGYFSEMRRISEK